MHYLTKQILTSSPKIFKLAKGLLWPQLNDKLNANQVRTDLYKANAGCKLRGLWEYSAWISEQLVYLPRSNKVKLPDRNNTWNADYDVIMFALQLMHTQVE